MLERIFGKPDNRGMAATSQQPTNSSDSTTVADASDRILSPDPFTPLYTNPAHIEPVDSEADDASDTGNDSGTDSGGDSGGGDMGGGGWN